MTINHPRRTHRLRRTAGLVVGLGLALLANLGDRAFSASAANSGIDPLEVLNLQVRNNGIILLDSSGSMRDITTFAGFSASSFSGGDLAGDDPNSKMFNAKQAIKKIIADNQTKVSFQFGRYVQSAGGFGTPTYLYTCSTSAVAPEIPCTSAADSTTFNGGFNRGSGDERTAGGVTTYALYNNTYRVNRHYRLKSGSNGACASNPDTAITTGAWTPPLTPTNWNLPNVPAGTNPNGPPFVEVERFGNTGCTGASTTTRFYFRGGQWAKANNTTVACGGFQSLVGLADCGLNDQFSLIGPYVGPEFVPTTVTGESLANLTSGATATAVRASGPTPLAESLLDMTDIFQGPGGLWNATISLQTPVKQRTFIIILTDGDDSCTNSSTFDSSPGTDLALRAAYDAQVLRDGIGASPDPASKVSTFVVAFGGAVSGDVNYIAWGGSGMRFTGSGLTGSGTAKRWANTPTTAERNACTTCVDAFPATDLDELTAALQRIVDLGSSSGEFADQQSVTETVYEYANDATPAKNPLDADERYGVSVPVLLQSTFEMPEFMGHLNAFRRGDNGTPSPADDTTVPLWDAGQKLYDRVTNPAPLTGMDPNTSYVFSDLYGNKDVMSSSSSAPKIRRRIYTTNQNGVNANYTAANLLSAASAALAGPSSGMMRVQMWPPSTGTTNNLFVAPTTTFSGGAGVRGILDTGMGLDALTTVAQVQAAVPGVCQGTVALDIPSDCTSVTAGLPLARAKREAREVILAYIAGARLLTSGTKPVRVPNGSNADELQYVVRPWILAESTLAAPGVVTPPLLAGPTTAVGAVGVEEYKAYRDGVKTSPSDLFPGPYLLNGLGLRNPDRTTSTDATVKTTLRNDLVRKPVMSVVYHATNQGLHAFRAGPCPKDLFVASAGIGAASSLECASGPGTSPDGETGGEELWAFVPYDQLGKLAALTRPQSRNSNKQYLLAAPVRFSDIFVPAAGGLFAPNGASLTGVWRTIMYVGRGQGGSYYTALDITVPGQFTRHSLNTEPPIVVWNRGNPDTTDGLVGGPPNNTFKPADTTAYRGMGETWSVPAVGFVTAASYKTNRYANGTNFVLFTGSGYSDNPLEGKTFFVLDALSGDIINGVGPFLIPDGSPAAPPVAVPPAPQDPPLTNFLVASPVVYSENADGNSPSGYRFIGNPISAQAKTVYFPDLHGRVWRYDATTPGTAPAKFFEATGVGNQPFATAVSVLQDRPDPAFPGDVYVYVESGYDQRVTPQSANPFKAYAFKDTNGVRTDVFAQDLVGTPGASGPTLYRGVTQPAAAFAGAFPPSPVVFFAGVKYNPPTGTICVSSFDSILFALKGIATVPGVPEPPFELTATGDDAFIELTGQKINAIRVSGEGNLVVDTGLNAQNAPPPPGVAVPPEVTSTSSSLVTNGLVPGTQAYKDLAATTVPYRVGSSVCRTQ